MYAIGNTLGTLRWALRSGPTQFSLISGAPRSGTTAVVQWLSQHPEVAGFTESRFSIAFHALLEQVDRFRRLSKREAAFLPAIRKAVYDCYGNVRPIVNKKLLLDKEPLEPIAFPDRQYRRYLENVKKLLPEAKLVLMIRSPCETVWSMRKRTWGGSIKGSEPRSFTLEEHTQNWKDCARLAIDYADRPDVHICVFENLVANPAAASKELFEFLNIRDAAPFEPRPTKAVAFEEADRRIVLDLTQSEVSALKQHGIVDYS